MGVVLKEVGMAYDISHMHHYTRTPPLGNPGSAPARGERKQTERQLQREISILLYY